MKKSSNRKGFTLIETLIAVAVVAILTAIAVPSLINTNKSLTTQQGNDYAKEIFMAVEHNLTAKKSSGNVPGAGESVYNEDETALISDVNELLKGNSSKRKELLEGDTEHQYKYITSGDKGFDEILPSDSIDSSILDGTTVTIIFNPVSADAFYVKYGDTGEYYGTVVSLVCSQYEDPVPVVELYNGEENVVTVTVPVPEDYQSNKTAYFNAITYKITVTEAGNDSNWFSYTYNMNDDNCTEEGFSFDYINQEASWSLDSLVLGRSFSDRNLGTDDKSDSIIQAGKDIEVEVTYSFDTPEGCRKIEFDRSSSIADGNSLFESYDASSGTITVSNGRNLQNLNSIDSDLAKTLAENGGIVKLGDNIHWEYTVSHYSSLDGGEKYYSALAASTVFQRFIPLKAEKLFAYGSKVTIDGCNHSINYLYINEDGDAGLFEDLLVDVSNLILTDPIVKGVGNAGSLASATGYYVPDGAESQLKLASNSVEISNCRVVISSESNISDNILNGTSTVGSTDDIFGAYSTGTGSAGMLIGAAYYTTITGCTDDNAVVDTGTAVFPASGTNCGLVAGYAEDCVINEIKAAGSIQGGQCSQLGGIVGVAQGANMSIIESEVSGEISNSKVNNLGGAIGIVYDGSFNEVTANMTIKNINYTNNTVYDTLECPSGLGTIGKFVGFIACGDYLTEEDGTVTGYITAGSFTNCKGIGKSTEKYQFLGAVKYLTFNLNGNYYSSNVQDQSESISASRDRDESNNFLNTYTRKNDSSDTPMKFEPVSTYIIYPIKEFTGNTYIYLNGTATKNQYISTNNLYDRTDIDDTYKITENKDDNGNILGPEDNKKYLIKSTTDSSFFSARKDVIPAGEIEQAVANKSVHIAEWPSFTASGFNLEVYGTLTGGYGMWSSKHDSEYDLFSYYYSSATDAPYNSETLDTSADLYRFVTESKDLEVENANGTKRTLEIKDGTELTLDEFQACKQSIWQWDTEGDNVNTLAFVDYDNDKKLAYMFIDAWYAKEGLIFSAKQETPALIADGNKWLSDKSPVDISYEIRNGAITFYRAQYYSVGWMVSFLVKKGETGLDGAYSRSNFDSSCYVTLFNIEDPTYDGTFKYLSDVYTQRMTTD